MSIKRIFKDGRAELKRKSRLRGSKKNLVEKEKTYDVKLTALGKKARDAKLDISQFGDLSGTLSQIEGKGKEIGAKLNELIKQTAELEGKKKAENARFNALWKDLETKKKPVESELKSEKDKLEKAQKEADSIQKRLKNIPDEEEKIGKKITESPGNAQSQAELEKKLAALKEEQEQLNPKLPDLTRFIQSAREKITPLDQQSGRLEAEMNKAKDQHKKEIEDIDKTLSKVKGEIDEFNKQQKAVSGQQVQNFQALGKKLSEANVTDPAIAAELNAVKAAEKEIGLLRTDIQSLESQKAPGARGAVWKMAGLIFLSVLVIAGIILSAVLISRAVAGKKPGEGVTKTTVSRVKKSETGESQENNKEADQLVSSILSEQKTAPLTQEEMNALTEKLEKLFPAIEEILKDMPRDFFDPQVVAQKIGNDPEKLFRWVQDNTYWIPYKGTLRGPQGVLMDRLGNSLDRSLLLAKLFQEAGYNVRLAHAKIPEGQAKELKKNLKPIPQNRYFVQGSSRGSLEELVDQFTQKYGLNQEDFQKSLRAADLESKAMIEKSNELIKTQSKLLEELIGMPQQAKNLADEEKVYGLQCLGDHWWVQLSRDNQWLDFDLLHPDTKPGKTLFPVETTCQPDEIKDDQIHNFDIRIVIEKWSKGTVKESIVFQHSLKPAELYGEPIMLGHNPMNWPKDLNFLNEKDPLEKIKEISMEEKEWLPYLAVGSKKIFQSSFTDSGDIHANPGGKEGGNVGGITKGLLNAFGGEEEAKIKQESFLSAEWIEYEIYIPGKPSRVVRREIFDLLGPAARVRNNFEAFNLGDAKKADRGLALLGSVDVLPLTGHLAPEFITYLVTKRVVELKDALWSFLKLDKESQRMKAGEFMALLKYISSPLSALALARQTLNPFSRVFYLDCLNIFNFRAGYSQDAKGKVRPFEFFDIVLNPVAISGPDKDFFSGRICQGIVDTVSEAVLYDSLESIENTGILFEKALRTGVKILALRTQQQDDIPRLGLPRDAAARLSETLDQGYIAVIPEDPGSAQAPGHSGWWRVDPKSGETIGVMGSGFNQGKSEYLITLEKIVEMIQAIKPYFFPGHPGMVGLEKIEKLIIYMIQHGVMSPGAVMALLGCGAVIFILVGIVIGLSMGG